MLIWICQTQLFLLHWYHRKSKTSSWVKLQNYIESTSTSIRIYQKFHKPRKTKISIIPYKTSKKPHNLKIFFHKNTPEASTSLTPMAFSTCDMCTSSPQPRIQCPWNPTWCWFFIRVRRVPAINTCCYEGLMTARKWCSMISAAAEVLWQAAPAEAATSSATFIASIFRESKTELRTTRFRRFNLIPPGHLCRKANAFLLQTGKPTTPVSTNVTPPSFFNGLLRQSESSGLTFCTRVRTRSVNGGKISLWFLGFFYVLHPQRVKNNLSVWNSFCMYISSYFIPRLRIASK